MKRTKTERFTLWIVAFFLLVFVEAGLFGNGNVIFFFLGAIVLYYGTHQRSKWMVFTAGVFIIIALLSLWSLRLLIFGILLYLVIRLWKGTPAEEIMRPLKEMERQTPNGIWKDRLFSQQSTPFTSYEWQDVHVQGLIGDFHIDVTDTVLPKETSLISIRQGLGRVKVELPYDLPVRVHCSILFGECRLFDLEPKRLLNESIHMKDGYDRNIGAEAELIISISVRFGDIEVIRK
ncbi:MULTISPECIES: cell wall-active antibiotics response protein LiaF [Sporosarcina]|uniref:cell wall-active antibiotics response protein LiaF n=1 Tax=Sporosarcina TaxID=1569 RepID=UPI00058C8F8E|nr:MULTISPECIES: cell wall-active antibiotics response protein LiaF [Sporosarcina]WJY26649.1 cell wall-active antibiotics response protein LiaF [Sporosarcina sp. 0.2-SM1T-5]